jgi:hypothetical protein
MSLGLATLIWNKWLSFLFDMSSEIIALSDENGNVPHDYAVSDEHVEQNESPALTPEFR